MNVGIIDGNGDAQAQYETVPNVVGHGVRDQMYMAQAHPIDVKQFTHVSITYSP